MGGEGNGGHAPHLLPTHQEKRQGQGEREKIGNLGENKKLNRKALFHIGVYFKI